MILSDIQSKLAEYKRLLDEEKLYQSILDLPIKCDLVGTVPINGASVEYRFNAPDPVVAGKAQNKLDTVRTKMAEIEGMFGITK